MVKLKAVFVGGHNGILEQVKQRLEHTVDLTFNLNQADVVVLWQDVMDYCKELAIKAKQAGKPVVVVEHGNCAYQDYCPPISYPLIANVLCVWGETNRQDLLKAGIAPSRIRVTGAPILNALCPKKEHQGKNVVFAPIHWPGDVVENQVIAQALRKISNINILTKVVEDHNQSWYDNPIYSPRDHPYHLSICAEVLSLADVVVGVAGGTFESLAVALDIPVILVDYWTPKKWLGRRIIDKLTDFPEAMAKTSLEELSKTVLEELDQPNRLASQRRRYAEERLGVGLPGNPVEKIVEVINEFAS